MNTHNTNNFLSQWFGDLWQVFVNELKRIFTDSGVILIFFVAGLAYPVIYNMMYYKNVVTEVPVAVVDMSSSPESRELVFRWNATQEVQVTHTCANMAQAEQLLKDQKVHGILYIPADYAAILNTGMETAHLSLYCDMSSLLYMKNVYLSANMVVLDKMQHVQVDRYEAMNIGSQMSWALVEAVQYEAVNMFNPTGGYGSFLIPAVLVLILHQTLFFGIAMLCGTAREENKEIFLLPGRRRRTSVYRIVTGRTLAYFVIYMAIGSFDLLLVPIIFNLPHLANPWDVIQFMIPFLLSTILFSLFLGSFQRERETGMVTMLFTSLIFLFISGVSWISENMDSVWINVAKLLPSTWGIHGYIHMQSMGASLSTTAYEYKALWVLTFLYMALCVISLSIRAHLYNEDLKKEDAERREKVRLLLHERRQKLAERQQKFFSRHHISGNAEA